MTLSEPLGRLRSLEFTRKSFQSHLSLKLCQSKSLHHFFTRESKTVRMKRVHLFSFSPKLRNLDFKKFGLYCYPRCCSVSCLQIKIGAQISKLPLVRSHRNFEITLKKSRFKPLSQGLSWTHVKVSLTLVFTRVFLQQLVGLQQQFAWNHLKSTGIKSMKSNCFYVQSLNQKYNCCPLTRYSDSEGLFRVGSHLDFVSSFRRPNSLRMSNPRVLLQSACLQPVRRHTWG
jgi:hypothetical protein